MFGKIQLLFIIEDTMETLNSNPLGGESHSRALHKIHSVRSQPSLALYFRFVNADRK